MSAEPLLARLDKVKQKAPHRWVACCPAHEDKNPSLSITDDSKAGDGRVLLKCWAGCSIDSILGAVGLQLSDLFPERFDFSPAGNHRRQHWHALREAMKCLEREAFVVGIAAEIMADGTRLEEEDELRLALAVVRIRSAAEACV